MTDQTLFDTLEAAIETVTKVAPDLFNRAHHAGDLVAQNGNHFAMASLDGRDGKCSVWAFLDMGTVLSVVTCTVHGNSINPARARALGEHLIAWADRKDPR
jgi:hypothetical protein